MPLEARRQPSMLAHHWLHYCGTRLAAHPHLHRQHLALTPSRAATSSRKRTPQFCPRCGRVGSAGWSRHVEIWQRHVQQLQPQPSCGGGHACGRSPCPAATHPRWCTPAPPPIGLPGVAAPTAWAATSAAAVSVRCDEGGTQCGCGCPRAPRGHHPGGGRRPALREHATAAPSPMLAAAAAAVSTALSCHRGSRRRRHFHHRGRVVWRQNGCGGLLRGATSW